MGTAFAFKKHNNVYLCVDSHYYGLVDRKSLKNPKNFKMWKVQPLNNVYMAYQGYHARIVDILRTDKELFSDSHFNGSRFDIPLLTKELIPKMFKLYESNLLLDPDKNENSLMGEFLLVSNKQILLISPDGHIAEYDDFAAIGNTDEAALGAYGALEKMEDPIKMSQKIMDSIIKYARHNRYPIASLDINNNQLNIIDRIEKLRKEINRL